MALISAYDPACRNSLIAMCAMDALGLPAPPGLGEFGLPVPPGLGALGLPVPPGLDALGLPVPPGLDALGLSVPPGLEHLGVHHFGLAGKWSEDSTDTTSTAASDLETEASTPTASFKMGSFKMDLHASDQVPDMELPAIPSKGKVNLIQKDWLNGSCWFHWTVDARKLKSKDKQIVSPNIELCPGASFKIMLIAQEMGTGKGQACFQKSRGRGSIMLKQIESSSCDALMGHFVTFCTGMGSAAATHSQPIACDDSNGGIPKSSETWDFGSAVDADSSTLVVSLKLLRGCPR